MGRGPGPSTVFDNGRRTRKPDRGTPPRRARCRTAPSRSDHTAAPQLQPCGEQRYPEVCKMLISPLSIVASAFLLLFLVLLLVPVLLRNQRLLITFSFSGIALAAAAAAVAGIWAVARGTVERMVLAGGLPDLPFHVRLDLLSGYF